MTAILKSLEDAGKCLSQCTVAIVGAGGNIGSTYARLLADHSPRLILVGRTSQQPTMHRLVRMLYEDAWTRVQAGGKSRAGLARAVAEAVAGTRPASGVDAGAWLMELFAAESPLRRPVVTTDDLMCLKEADVIVTGTNSSEPVIFPQHLSERPVVICDIAVPSDVAPSVLSDRPHARVVSTGVIALPAGCDIDFRVTGLARGRVFACLAETLLLGLEGITRSYSYGDVRPSDVSEIAAIASRHGFELAPVATGD
jgi:predicted amino acid dehydrogenase